MHPILKEGTSLGCYQEGEHTFYFAENAEGDDFVISPRLYNALKTADGTHPLELPDRGRQLLPRLKEAGLVQTSRFVRSNGLINRFILFPISRQSRGSPVCGCINALLPPLAVLVFLLGVWLMQANRVFTGYQFSMPLYYCLIAFSVCFHEWGHFIASRAFGYRVYDVGLILLVVIPIGAYVSYENRQDKRWKRAQLCLAGIEADLLLAGICLVLTALAPNHSLASLLVATANFNVVLAITNLVPISGLDGETALSAILGLDSAANSAKRWVLKSRLRKRLLHHGPRGWLIFVGFLALLLAKWSFYAYMIWEVIQLFS